MYQNDTPTQTFLNSTHQSYTVDILHLFKHNNISATALLIYVKALPLGETRISVKEFCFITGLSRSSCYRAYKFLIENDLISNDYVLIEAKGVINGKT